MFNTDGLVSGEEFTIKFVATPKDEMVSKIVELCGVGPFPAVFWKQGARTSAGTTAIHDTVSVRLPSKWGGLWPHEDGEDYMLV